MMPRRDNITRTQVITTAKASSGMNKNKSENYTSQKNGTLTASNNTVEVENAYTMSTAYIYVYSVDLKYR